MTPLGTRILPSLPASVSTPSYDREPGADGIVHFGVGGFHRSHEAMYVDGCCSRASRRLGDLRRRGAAVGRAMREALDAQDCLYTLVVKAPDGTVEARVIGSIGRYLLAPGRPEPVVEKLADPSTRIVSMTVTEGGYIVSRRHR